MDDFIEVIKSIQMVQGTASTLVLQGAILDLAARLDEAEKRIGELEKASPCPMLKSICEDWEYNAKSKPYKEESKEPPEFRTFCERVFEPGTDYRTGDIRFLLREHIDELREIVARWDAGV